MLKRRRRRIGRERERSFYASEGFENPEAVVKLSNGLELRCPAYPARCEYVRVTTANGINEIVYYDELEFEEDAAGTLGSLMGALKSKGR